MSQACRVCGCTNFSACEGGCWWVEDDLCSSCSPAPAPTQLGKPKERVVLSGNVAAKFNVSTPGDVVIENITQVFVPDRGEWIVVPALTWAEMVTKVLQYEAVDSKIVDLRAQRAARKRDRRN